MNLMFLTLNRTFICHHSKYYCFIYLVDNRLMYNIKQINFNLILCNVVLYFKLHLGISNFIN